MNVKKFNSIKIYPQMSSQCQALSVANCPVPVLYRTWRRGAGLSTRWRKWVRSELSSEQQEGA